LKALCPNDEMSRLELWDILECSKYLRSVRSIEVSRYVKTDSDGAINTARALLKALALVEVEKGKTI
jgi:hypothetical protein